MPSLLKEGIFMSNQASFSMADMTDPRILKKCGLKRKGNFMVTDDETEEIFYEYTPEEMETIRKREVS